MNLIRRFALLAAGLALLVAAAGCGSVPTAAKPADSPREVVVEMINSRGMNTGTAVVTQMAKGVLIRIDAHGLPPGKHAFHVHEKGSCEPPNFKSAGGHYNPAEKGHGFNNPNGYHAGDFPDLIADESGRVKGEVFTTQLTLAKGKKNSLLKPGGTALMIHERGDDYKTDPAGNAGERIACGVIR